MHCSARIPVAISALLFLVLLAGCSLLEDTPEPAPSGVAENIQAGNYRAAIQTLNGRIRKEPGNAALYTERALIYLELGSPGQASRDVEQALKLAPQSADAWCAKAALLLSGKTVGPVLAPRSQPGMDATISPQEIAGARQALARCLELDPNNARARMLLGRAARLSGDPQAALAELQKARELDESLPETFIELAVCSEMLQHWTEAARYYDEAVALQPGEVALLLGAAQAHWNIGEFGTAAEQLEHASELRPGDHTIFSHLALVYAADGDAEQAKHYDGLARRKAALQNLPFTSSIVVADDGTVRPAVQPGGLEAEQQARAAAEESGKKADKARAEAPKTEPVRRDLMAEARQAFKKGNADAALALISERFDQAEPTAGDYCFQSNVLARLKQQDLAADAASNAIKADPDNFCGYNNLGVLTAAKDPQGAIRVFDKGIERLPKVAALHNERGKVYLKLKQYDPAERDFDAAVAADPNAAIHFLHRAIARFHLQRYDAALKDADKFLLMSPNAAVGYQTRAAIQRKLGNEEQAKKDLAAAEKLGAK